MNHVMETIAPEELPAILLAEEEFDELSDIARSLTHVLPEVARLLKRELARARLVPLAEMPGDVVTMHATVSFRLGAEETAERLKLVYPAEKAADDGCISIASPVGVALLGLRAGQTIAFHSRYGKPRWLKVTSVARNA